MYQWRKRCVSWERRMIDLSPISVPDLNKIWGSRGGKERVEVENNNMSIKLMFGVEERFCYCSSFVVISNHCITNMSGT